MAKFFVQCSKVLQGTCPLQDGNIPSTLMQYKAHSPFFLNELVGHFPYSSQENRKYLFPNPIPNFFFIFYLLNKYNTGL